jgi:hypothetical protein
MYFLWGTDRVFISQKMAFLIATALKTSFLHNVNLFGFSCSSSFLLLLCQWVFKVRIMFISIIALKNNRMHNLKKVNSSHWFLNIFLHCLLQKANSSTWCPLVLNYTGNFAAMCQDLWVRGNLLHNHSHFVSEKFITYISPDSLSSICLSFLILFIVAKLCLFVTCLHFLLWIIKLFIYT